MLWNNALWSCGDAPPIYLPRTLARLTGMTQKRLREHVRVAYVKVAEYQRRGLVHLHAVIRLDQAMPTYRAHEVHPPPERFGVELLEDALRATVAEVDAPLPGELGGGRVRWGDELDIRQLDTEARRRGRRLPGQVRHQEHRTGRRRAAPRRRAPGRRAARARARAPLPARRIHARRRPRARRPPARARARTSSATAATASPRAGATRRRSRRCARRASGTCTSRSSPAPATPRSARSPTRLSGSRASGMSGRAISQLPTRSSRLPRRREPAKPDDWPVRRPTRPRAHGVRGAKVCQTIRAARRRPAGGGRRWHGGEGGGRAAKSSGSPIARPRSRRRSVCRAGRFTARLRRASCARPACAAGVGCSCRRMRRRRGSTGT